MSMNQSEYIACVLAGNGQSNPNAGPVSWALQRQFESICRQFAHYLSNHEPGFDSEQFMRRCGIDPNKGQA